MSLRFFYRDLTASSGSSSIIRNLKWLLFTHSIHLTFLIRVGQSCRRIPFLGRFLSFIFEYIIRVLYASDISCKAEIGPGLNLMHGHDIVIGADVLIGSNCKIFNGVTLGNKDTEKPSTDNQPKVGSNVQICTGAKLLGPIRVGDNSIIGANSVVVKDVPSNVVVGGVPAKIIKNRGTLF